MKIKRILPALLAFAAVFTSCIKEESILYTGTEMCKVLDRTHLYSDNGMIMNIVENFTDEIPEGTERVMINCDVLSESGTAQDEYDIRLIAFSPVNIIEPVASSTADQDSLGNDCIGIDAAWLGGGFINAYGVITMLVNSATEHTVNLEFDDIRSNSDTLYFQFRHNAFGESLDNRDLSEANITVSGQYYSFPIDNLVPAGKNSIVVHLESEWFETHDNVLSHDKKLFTGDLIYTK